MRKLILLTGLLAGSVSAHAADNGIYVGASLGQANVEVEDIDATTREDFKGDDLGYKLFIGVRPLDWLGFEADYVNFGEPEDRVNGVEVQTEGYGIAGYAIGFLSLGPVDLFAKGGLVSWDTKSIDRSDLDGTDLAYGAGVQFRLLSLGVRAEYEVFDIDYAENTSMLSVGVSYTFL